MHYGNLHCNHPVWHHGGPIARIAGGWVRTAIGVVTLLGILLAADCGFSDTPALTEYQVKALFLLNFTKYVEWPTDPSGQPDAPFVIGIMDSDKIESDLVKAIAGKTANGRPITVRPLVRGDDAGHCQILFIGVAEKNHVEEILASVKGKPVLTVGETEQFAQQGGIINFTKREGKVRLEIDLNAARAAGLQLSSKLLGVADTVRGKQ